MRVSISLAEVAQFSLLFLDFQGLKVHNCDVLKSGWLPLLRELKMACIEWAHYYSSLSSMMVKPPLFSQIHVLLCGYNNHLCIWIWLEWNLLISLLLPQYHPWQFNPQDSIPSFQVISSKHSTYFHVVVLDKSSF